MADSRGDSRLSMELAQRQRLRLSPVQMRYGALLEMSAPELEDEVRTAVEENPALEVAEAPAEAVVESPDRMLPPYGGYSPDDESGEPQQASDAPTLGELLAAQLREHTLTPRELVIGDYIIGNIDDNGYLMRPVRAMASDLEVATGDEVAPAEVERVLTLIRDNLDPAGVGAETLRECLLLQLRRAATAHESDAHVGAALRVMEDDGLYKLFVNRQRHRLAERLDMAEGDVEAVTSLIASLNPKPGAAVAPPGDSERANTVVPDFVVERDGERFVVTVPNRLPELALAESFDFAKHPPVTRRETEAARVAAPYRDEALTLIRALKMRQETMMAVMKAVVGLQKPFFTTQQKRDIRPMLLKDVAALTGLDVSTVSRATSGKYVLTEGGVYPMRTFFNERSGESGDITSHAVMDEIARLIEAEDSSAPLSDDAIAAALGQGGMKVARRTVAKYRELMEIPVARMRKKA